MTARVLVAYGPVRSAGGFLVGSGRDWTGPGSLRELWRRAERLERARAAGLPVGEWHVAWHEYVVGEVGS